MLSKATLGLAFAAGLLAAPAFAQQAEDPPTLTERARAGNLQVVQFWADDAQTFLAEWARPTPPRLTVTTATLRNDPITMFIVFAGCTPDPQGNCRLTGKTEMTDPDGLPYGTGHEFPVSQSPAATDPTLLVLSPSSLQVTIEDGEKLGTYRMRLSVTDEVAGVTAVTVEELTVSEPAAAE